MTDIVKSNSGIAVSNPEEFLQFYNPKTLNEVVRSIRDVPALIKADSNSIALCKKELGVELIGDTIKMHIVSLCEFINVHKNLTGGQVEELTRIILSDFYFISITELAHIFGRAKSGQFGEFKFSLNIGDVIGWLQTYQEQRTMEFMQNQEKAHEERKNGKQVVFNEETGESTIQQNGQLHELQVKALSEFKKRMPNKKKGFEDFKKEFEENGIELVDQSENEELNRMKEELAKKYAK